VRLQRKCSFRVKAAKELYFNKDGSATKKLQVSVTHLAHPIFISHFMPVCLMSLKQTLMSCFICILGWSQQACRSCWSYTGTKGKECCFGEQVWVS
jgi:hypothetical protein